eukprot:3620283-Prymnesium_polylepis.3
MISCVQQIERLLANAIVRGRCAKGKGSGLIQGGCIGCRIWSVAAETLCVLTLWLEGADRTCGSHSGRDRGCHFPHSMPLSPRHSPPPAPLPSPYSTAMP